ncbi:hypothetical protein E4T56_gene11143 [Termitomyces sp. T112]|nr:hypothetical protein E4T56_gene11143 [Termitomyces sp. T112]
MDGYAPLDTMLPDDMQAPLLSLSPLPRQFLVPPLTNKPQNPIMDTLQRTQEIKSTSLLFQSHLELGSLVADPLLNLRPKIPVYDFWRNASTRNLGIKNKAQSWDRLRPSHPDQAFSTGFLSEQDDLVLAAARYHVNLRLLDPKVEMTYITQCNTLNALKRIVLGTSSVYHTWNPEAERFIQAGVEDNKTGCILIDGKDEVVSQSLISRFIAIGTLLRRLETFLTFLRARSAQDGPAVHAYAHALATIITYLRHSLAKCPPVNDPLSPQNTLTAIWMHYEIYEETFVALAGLYGRDEHKTPEEYPTFDPSPVALLSSIYTHLERHIERQSPRIIVAIFAFMLTHVSHDYLQQISRSVGYGMDSLKKASRGTGKALNKDPFENEEEGNEEDIFDILERVGETFPKFFPRRLLDILPAAQKSLILLERAQPDHPMLRHTMTQGTIQWFWTESLIQMAWKGHYSSGWSGTVVDSVTSVEELCHNQELAIFRVFDLEPGTNPATSTALAKAQSMTQSLQSFIDVFPASLPSITPTLSHLTSLVFAPLVDHASTLSATLLDLFLTPSSTAQDGLNFEAHLTLLHSYLLLTSPPFKARLAAALFSDTAAGEVDTRVHGLAILSSGRKPHTKQTASIDRLSQQQQQRPWAVGLAPSLLERETWPPVGADLSFLLRTVIVDSIDNCWNRNFAGCGGDEKPRSCVLEEAEYRLGFAIRDLSTSGRDKWLNPLSIEALDFLYMDYKPPTALEVLITPDILSKYQRIFTFVLRLMRVEHAVISLFRMTRITAQPLFPTLTPSRKALLHFRFVAQSFVSNLSAYVFDTAISGNFDSFLTRLSMHGKNEEDNEINSSFPDVFALAKSHSVLLDDILTACLLRSGQRTVGEVLRNALDLILEFTVVVGQLHCRRLAEYEAATLLVDISKKFFSRMAMLTKVLRGLADKNDLSERTLLLHGSLPTVETPHKPTGGADALYHLLIRLDLGEYWMTSR